MASSFIHIVTCARIFFLLRSEYLIGGIYHVLFVHSPTEEHFVCFYVLITINNAATDILGVQI